MAPIVILDKGCWALLRATCFQGRDRVDLQPETCTPTYYSVQCESQLRQ